MITATNVGALRARGRSVASVLPQYGIVVALLLLCALISILSPAFLTQRNLFNVADQMAIAGVMGVGMTILMVSGSFDLSVGSTLGISGALCLGLSDRLTIGGAIVVALAAGFAIGLVNGLIVTKAGINALIVTLGMMSLVRGIVLIDSNGASISAPPSANSLVNLANSSLWLPTITWVLIFTALAGIFIMSRSTIGRYITAVGGNAEAAEIAGVRVDVYRIGAFVAMGVLAALAGVMYAGEFAAVDPSAGSGMELNVIAAVIIGGTSLFGGVGSIWKSVAGVALLTVLTDGFNLLNVNPYYQYVAQGLVIICAVALYTRRSTR
jgi:ribose transport system permease protein